MTTPKNVSIAVWLLYASVVAMTIAIFAGLFKPMEVGVEQETMVMSVVILALMQSFHAWTVYKVGKGKNWARYFRAVMLFLSLCFIVNGLYRDTMEMFDIAISVVEITLAGAGVALLFSRSSNEWFQQKSPKLT